MRAVPLTVAALAAALLLTGCSDSDDSGSDGTESKAADGACAPGDLNGQVDAGAAPAAGDTGTVTVTLTNTGAECTLDDFPTVELHAGDTSVSVPKDKAAEARKLTLTEQGTTSFTITYTRGASGSTGSTGDKAGSLAVKTAAYGLPGATKTESFTWSYGNVALTNADKPEASVSAFQQAGD